MPPPHDDDSSDPIAAAAAAMAKGDQNWSSAGHCAYTVCLRSTGGPVTARATPMRSADDGSWDINVIVSATVSGAPAHVARLARHATEAVAAALSDGHP